MIGAGNTGRLPWLADQIRTPETRHGPYAQ